MNWIRCSNLIASAGIVVEIEKGGRAREGQGGGGEQQAGGVASRSASGARQPRPDPTAADDEGAGGAGEGAAGEARRRLDRRSVHLQDEFDPEHLSRDQAGPLHSGDDAADVQDPGAQRPGAGLQPVGALPGRRQIQRRTGHAAGTPAGRLFPLHIQIETAQVAVETAPAAQHFQLVHHPHGPAPVPGALLQSGVSGAAVLAAAACQGPGQPLPRSGQGVRAQLSQQHRVHHQHGPAGVDHCRQLPRPPLHGEFEGESRPALQSDLYGQFHPGPGHGPHPRDQSRFRYCRFRSGISQFAGRRPGRRLRPGLRRRPYLFVRFR